MRNLFELAEDPKNYSAVRIKLATAEDVISWSYGEVRSSETINYRTFNLKEMVCSAVKFSVRFTITNASVGNTKG